MTIHSKSTLTTYIFSHPPPSTNFDRLTYTLGLSAEANILYATASITLILGYQPEEVIGRSVFDYFHPEEVPFARDVHQRGVQMDKAAALHYARIQDRNGQWVSCECIFSVVYNVLVACTSIYKRDAKNERE